MQDEADIDWRQIKAVTLDVGGTLIEPWPSVGHVYADVAAAHGVVADVHELNAAFANAWRERTQFSYSQAEWFEIIRATFGAHSRRIPEVCLHRLYRRFVEPDVWRIFDDVRSVIDSLKAMSVRLAIISNWDDRLLPLLKNLGLHDAFEAIIVSCEVGATKPDAAIFQEAMRRLDLAATHVLHVGDSHREDVLGARSAGMSALRINRKGAESLTTLLEPLLHRDKRP